MSSPDDFLNDNTFKLYLESYIEEYGPEDKPDGFERVLYKGKVVEAPKLSKVAWQSIYDPERLEQIRTSLIYTVSEFNEALRIKYLHDKYEPKAPTWNQKFWFQSKPRGRPPGTKKQEPHDDDDDDDDEPPKKKYVTEATLQKLLADNNKQLLEMLKK